MFSVRSLIVAVVLSACSIGVGATPAPAAGIDVSGSGAGISQMYGGTVQLGLTPEDVTALAKATGNELVRQCALISQRVSAEVALTQTQSVSIGVVEGFLATIKGRKIPQDEWPEVFGELTRQYLQAGEQRPTSPGVRVVAGELVGQADELHSHNWRHGVLDLNREALSEVVKQLNRYTSKIIRIEDPRLQNITLSGCIRVFDVPGALFLMERVLPISVTQTDDAFILTYRSGWRPRV